MKYFLFIVFLILNICLSAQQWKKTYSPMYCPEWVIENYDKGYIILGTRTGAAAYMQIIKTDINGNVLWKKHLGSFQYQIIGMNIENTADNGLVIGGSMSKYGNQWDAFILKLNSCGEVDWCSDLYTPTLTDDQGMRVKPATDGGYFLLGSYNDPNPNLRTNLFKFDSLGNLLWHQKYLPDSAAYYDDAWDLTVDSTSCLITADCYYPNPGQSGGWIRFYLIRTDINGNKLWSCIYGSASHYYGDAFASIEGSTGNYYSFGQHIIDSSNQWVPAMIKVMKNGSPAYNKDIISNVGTGGIAAAASLNDSTLVLGGGWAINNYYGTDALFKTDTLGNVILSKILDTTASAINSLAKTFDNKIISVTSDYTNNHSVIVAYKVNSNLQWDSLYNYVYTYDSICPHLITSDTINPNCQQVVNVEEPLSNPETCKLKIFPNPATNKLIVVFPQYLMVSDNSGPIKSTTIYHNWETSIFEIYNLNGELILQKEIPKNQIQLELNVSTWQKGLYLFRLVHNTQNVAEQKVIIQ